MLVTKDEIRSVAQAVGRDKALELGKAIGVEWFENILQIAMQRILALADEKAKPKAVVARTYNEGDILRSREDHSVTIRLTSIFSKDSWWVSSMSDATKVGAWPLYRRTLDLDWEPVDATVDATGFDL